MCCIVITLFDWFYVNYGNTFFKFKDHFKNLNFYSIPKSILFIVRKRLNLIYWIVWILIFTLISIL